MSMLDPFEFDPDDERLSRYLDDDLDVDERAELERELALRPELRARLAELDAAASWIATSPSPLSPSEAEAMVGAALAAFDTAVAERSTPAAPTSVVAPLAPRRKPSRLWSPNLIGLSAAALLVIVAIAALVRSGSGDDSAGSTDSAETAALAFEPERGVAESMSTKSGAAAGATANDADATGAELQSSPAAGVDDLLSPVELGPFDDVEGLVEAVAARSGLTGASVSSQPATTAAATASTEPPATGQPPLSTTAVSTSAATGLGICRPENSGSASIDGRPVRWTVLGSGTPGDPRRITVIDAATCAVLVDRVL